MYAHFSSPSPLESIYPLATFKKRRTAQFEKRERGKNKRTRRKFVFLLRQTWLEMMVVGENLSRLQEVAGKEPRRIGVAQFQEEGSVRYNPSKW